MRWFGDIWTWLDINSKQLGALSSVVFGVSSAVVAWVALRLNYRNNFGWPPIAIIMSYGLNSTADRTEAFVAYEIWNRRKYPLVVREMQVMFGSAKIDRVTEQGKGEQVVDWYVTNDGGLVGSQSITLEPSKHYAFEAPGVVRGDRDPFFNDHKPVELWVDIFDPRTNRHLVLRAKGKDAKRRWWRREPKRRMPHYTSYGGRRPER
jgi:hypothetical protein